MRGGALTDGIVSTIVADGRGAVMLHMYAHAHALLARASKEGYTGYTLAIIWLKMISRVLLCVCLAGVSALRAPGSASSRRQVIAHMSESEALPPSVKAKIGKMVGDNKVMLFMKGTKIFPQCGFSNMAIQILNSIGD